MSWVKKQKYLGVLLSESCKDDNDLNRQLRCIYARGNMLLRKFGKCSQDVKVRLFKTFCSNIYCGHLWQHFNKSTFSKLNVAYNNVFRLLFKFPRGESISNMYVSVGIDHFTVIVRNMINGFNSRLHCSENSLLQTVVNSLFFIYDSKLAEKWVTITHNRHGH